MNETTFFCIVALALVYAPCALVYVLDCAKYVRDIYDAAHAK